MTTTTTLISVFVNTWANYNTNGADGGFWVALPCNLDEVRAQLAERTGEDVGSMEMFVNDYETSIDGLDIDEYTDLAKLNETAEMLDSLDESELEELEAIIEVTGNFAYALEIYERGEYTYYSGMTLEDVAEEFVDEGGFGNIPDNIRYYIDYSAIARGLEFDGYTETANGVIYMG